MVIVMRDDDGTPKTPSQLIGVAVTKRPAAQVGAALEKIVTERGMG
jgi:hypothetical protein